MRERILSDEELRPLMLNHKLGARRLMKLAGISQFEYYGLRKGIKGYRNACKRVMLSEPARARLSRVLIQHFNGEVWVENGEVVWRSGGAKPAPMAKVSVTPTGHRLDLTKPQEGCSMPPFLKPFVEKG